MLVKVCWTEDFAAVLAEMVSLMLSFLVPFPDRLPVSRICKFHWKIAVCCDPYRLILEARAPRERHAFPEGILRDYHRDADRHGGGVPADAQPFRWVQDITEPALVEIDGLAIKERGTAFRDPYEVVRLPVGIGILLLTVDVLTCSTALMRVPSFFFPFTRET